MKAMVKISALFSTVIVLAVSTFTLSDFAQASSEQTFIVLYKQENVPANARSAIELAGGTLLFSYDKIGVAIARSDSLAFHVELMKNKKVEGVSSTAGFAFSIDDDFTIIEDADLLPLDEVNTSDPWGDLRSHLQWDMNMGKIFRCTQKWKSKTCHTKVRVTSGKTISHKLAKLFRNAVYILSKRWMGFINWKIGKFNRVCVIGQP